MRPNIFAVLCLAAAFTNPPFLMADTQGNGVIAAPTAAAYADLNIASHRILGDLQNALPQAKTIILYDGPTFTVIPYYASTADLIRTAVLNMCNEDAVPASPRTVVPSLDVGSSAQGLVSLIQMTLPSYSIQGQNIALDNSALVGNFATAASGTGFTVINPTYLLPAVSQSDLTCENAKTSNSLADLWKFANREAGAVRSRAGSKKPLQDTLDAFQKLKDVLLAAPAQGAPLLGRALIVESVARAVDQQPQVAVIDMRLDTAGIDSTTKTVLWWRKTKFSANVAAHYWIFSAHGTGAQFGVTLVQPGYVNILRQDVNLKGFSIPGH